MATAYHHAVSSARRLGGEPEDYVEIHEFFDATSKLNLGDFRHRALRHHTFGIEQCILLFGEAITTAGGGFEVPVRVVAEDHVLEDHRRVPTPLDWLSRLAPAPPTDAAPFRTDDQAEASAKRWGGEPEEYLEVHRFFDDTAPETPGDARHRALRHHTTGVRECEERFGRAMRLSTGRTIPVRWVAERHLAEEFGVLVTAADWLKRIRRERWMADARPLSREIQVQDAAIAVATDVRRPKKE